MIALAKQDIAKNEGEGEGEQTQRIRDLLERIPLPHPFFKCDLKISAPHVFRAPRLLPHYTCIYEYIFMYGKFFREYFFSVPSVYLCY